MGLGGTSCVEVELVGVSVGVWIWVSELGVFSATEAIEDVTLM